MRLISDERGFTLIELLVGVLCLGTALTAALAVLLVGQTSGYQMMKWEEKTQNLRLATKQIMDDSQYAQWTNQPGTNTDIVLWAYRQRTSRTDAYWSNKDAGWPGDLLNYDPIYIKFVLEGNSLIRETGSGSVVSSRQVLATGLEESGSYLQAKENNLLQVRLQAEWEQARGKRLVEVYTEIFLPSLQYP